MRVWHRALLHQLTYLQKKKITVLQALLIYRYEAQEGNSFIALKVKTAMPHAHLGILML